METPIVRSYGPFQVYIYSIGNQLELVLPFLREWIGGIKTLAAVRYRVEEDIIRVQPTLYGLAQETAEVVANRLREWGADAAVFHEKDENRPQFDHNRYGLSLLEVGENREAATKAVQNILDLDRLKATILVDSAPRQLLENVSVDQAIAGHRLLIEAGATCEIIQPDPIWLNPSTDHIIVKPGPYAVILQLIGFQTMLVGRLVDNLLAQTPENERRELLQDLPAILLKNVSLETAELAKLTFEQLGATVVIQNMEARQKLGPEIHDQNPDFASGHYQVVLEDFDQFRKIKLIQEIRKLIPGVFLTDVTAMLKNMPAVVIKDVDLNTANTIRDQLQSTGARINVRIGM